MPIEPRTFDILEQETGSYSAIFTGNDGVTPLPLATIQTAVLTLYAILTNGTVQIINSRNAQNILNANNVVVDANGRLTWTIQVADTTLQEVLPFERHVALFEWTWPQGAGKHEIVLVVQNLTEVP
jgi:hypothetical protein